LLRTDLLGDHLKKPGENRAKLNKRRIEYGNARSNDLAAQRLKEMGEKNEANRMGKKPEIRARKAAKQRCRRQEARKARRDSKQ
jgi:hypothetical protein